MIKFFRNIRKKLLAEGKTANYFKYAIGEIVLAFTDKTGLCPVRDTILVAVMNTKSNPRAFRYGILYNVPKGTKNIFTK
jgi:hypothetical protein